MQAHHCREDQSRDLSAIELSQAVLPDTTARTTLRQLRPTFGQPTFRPGSHLITPRRGYRHHGIYVGNGKVVHYAGSTQGILSGPIEEISLDRFAFGRAVWTSRIAPTRFSSDEVIRRARFRLGENHYRLISNNCEHFCEWCLRGEHRSYQIEAWQQIPRRALDAVGRFKASLLKCLRAEVHSDVELS
jgi:hypothetical protein